MQDLVTVLEQFIVPRPHMIVRDRKTGKHGKVEFFQWRKDGTTSKIPVKMEDGSSVLVDVGAFGRRYSVVQDNDPVYLKQQAEKKLKVLLDRRLDAIKVIQEFDSIIRSLKGSNPVLKNAALAQQAHLEGQKEELEKEIAALKDQIQSYGI